MEHLPPRQGPLLAPAAQSVPGREDSDVSSLPRPPTGSVDRSGPGPHSAQRAARGRGGVHHLPSRTRRSGLGPAWGPGGLPARLPTGLAVGGIVPVLSQRPRHRGPVAPVELVPPRGRLPSLPHAGGGPLQSGGPRFPDPESGPGPFGSGPGRGTPGCRPQHRSWSQHPQRAPQPLAGPGGPLPTFGGRRALSLPQSLPGGGRGQHAVAFRACPGPELAVAVPFRQRPGAPALPVSSGAAGLGGGAGAGMHRGLVEGPGPALRRPS